MLNMISHEKAVISSKKIITSKKAPMFLEDLGVTYGNHKPMIRIRSKLKPSKGQYSVSKGVYTFAKRDIGKTIIFTSLYQGS